MESHGIWKVKKSTNPVILSTHYWIFIPLTPSCIVDPFSPIHPTHPFSLYFAFHSVFRPLSLISHAPYWPNPTHSYYFSQYLSLSLSSTADKAKLSLKDVGLQDCDFKTGELWGFAGYKKRDEGVAVGFLQGFDTVELDTELNLGWHFKTRRQLLKYYVCCEVNSVGTASTHLQNMYRRFYIQVISMQLMGYLPISELQKLVAQQENLLVPDN